MKKEILFGKHIYQNKPKKSRIIATTIFAIISLIFCNLLSLISVFMILNNDISAGIFFLILSLPVTILLIYVLAKKKMIPYTANIYEHGITLNRASERLAFDFKDLDGISVSKQGLFVNGAVSNIWETAILTIYPSQSKPICLYANGLQAVADYLDETYTNYIIRSLTKENIKNKIIKFGKYIELNNGKIIHKYYKKELPLESITGIVEEDGMAVLKGKNDSFPLNDSQWMNFNVLYHIIYKINDENN